jgi:hypothetical protein
MDDLARFSSPVSVPRPRGSRLIEAYSPKLGRRLKCFGRHAFEQWIRLESDSAVLTFCERPVAWDQNGEQRLIDFWVQDRDQEILLVVGDDPPVPTKAIGNISLPVRAIPLAELAAARIWIANWERMMPSMIACRTSLADALLKAVARFVVEPLPLSRIERELGLGDPTPVRAAVFTLLHRGRLQAPKLITEPLSYLTPFAPAGEHP